MGLGHCTASWFHVYEVVLVDKAARGGWDRVAGLRGVSLLHTCGRVKIR